VCVAFDNGRAISALSLFSPHLLSKAGQRTISVTDISRFRSSAVAQRDANELLPLTPVVLHILLALADERQGKHGYAVAREVEELTDGQIRMGPGTLYGSIQRMLDADLIEERRVRSTSDDDERRRYYRITALGRRVLEREVARLADVVAIARRKQLLPA
jgi:DNA-binding PadR family transcriptional regulator